MKSARSLVAIGSLAALATLSVAACGWTPSHPLDRFSPAVSKANEAIEAGKAAEAVDPLTEYLATGACDDGAIGAPATLTERPAATYDLGLALFGTALPAEVRFGPRVVVKDEAAKKLRTARVACALRVVRAFLEGDGVDDEVRRRARFLEGNLLAIDERYDEAIAAYDKALARSPADPNADAGSPVDRDIAWNRAVVLAWREEAKQDAGSPDGGESGDGGSSQPDGGGQGDSGSPDASSGDSGSPDAGPPNAGAPGKPDAGPDAGPVGGKNEPNKPDSGPPQDSGAPPPPPPKSGGMSDDDLLDKLSRAPTLQREAVRRQAKQSRGLVDK
jgi:tetratricopeptide (TPR) repeat protein